MITDIALFGLILSSSPAWAAEQGIQSSDYTNAALSSAQYRDKIRCSYLLLGHRLGFRCMCRLQAYTLGCAHCCRR